MAYNAIAYLFTVCAGREPESSGGCTTITDQSDTSRLPQLRDVDDWPFRHAATCRVLFALNAREKIRALANAASCSIIVRVASRCRNSRVPLGCTAARCAGVAEATIGQAAKLSSIGAIFFICDAIQSVAAGSLRGLKDTRVLLLFAVISFG